MTSITKITCDQCEEEIFNYCFDSKWTVSYISSFTNQDIHFCNLDHMMEYLNTKYNKANKPNQDERP